MTCDLLTLSQLYVDYFVLLNLGWQFFDYSIRAEVTSDYSAIFETHVQTQGRRSEDGQRYVSAPVVFRH